MTLRPSPDSHADAPEPDPVVEAYKKDVDRTLIHAQLQRSVDERIQTMVSALALAEALGEAGRRPAPKR